MIGGSLLMGGIRSAMAGHQGGGPASKAFEDFGGRGGSPWSGAAAAISRAKPVSTISAAAARGLAAATSRRRAGLFDQAEQDRRRIRSRIRTRSTTTAAMTADFDGGDSEET